MRIRRAVGAAALVLATAATLSGCADDPKDKAYGGLGEVPDDIPTSGPSALPSAPSDLPSAPSLDPGASSGGSGGSTDLPSATPTSPSEPTYDSSATGDLKGENCRYSRSTSQIKYDVDIQNSSSDTSFEYRFTVKFKVGSSPNASVATVPVGTQYETATVSPSGNRTVTVDVTHTVPSSQGLRFSCQVTTATKSPSS